MFRDARLEQWLTCYQKAAEMVSLRRASAPLCFDPVCTFVAVAIGGAAVVGVGASAFAASEQAGAAEDANQANLQNARDTNALNLQLFRESRGSKGSSIYPTFATDSGGAPFEPIFFGNTRAVYDALARTPPADELSYYRQVLAPLISSQQGAERTAAGIFNGDITQEGLSDFAPVGQARQDVAQSRKSAGLEALSQTLNDIGAIQARKGFVGDTTNSNLIRFNARRQINADAATEIGGASLANQEDINRIKAAGINLRVGNLDLPYKIARQSVSNANLPEDALLDQTARRQQLFNAFRIGPNAFQYQPLPPVIATPSTGAIVGQGIGQVAGSAENLLVSKYLADKIFGGFNALTPAQKYGAFAGATNLGAFAAGGGL